MRALDLAPVGERHGHHVTGAGHGLHPGAREHVHPAAGEHLLEDLGGVGVLAGQHPVAAGDQGDRDAEGEVAGRELGAGDAGADHDQLGRHLVEVVDLFPGQDPLAVRLRGGQGARRGAGGDQDGVRLERLVAGHHPCGAVEPAARLHDPDALLLQPLRDVVALRVRQRLDPPVDPGQVDPDPVLPDHHAELVGAGDVGHQLRGRDQGLAGDAVGEDRGAAQPVAVHDGDLGAELRRDQRSLVAARSAADDNDVVRHERAIARG